MLSEPRNTPPIINTAEGLEDLVNTLSQAPVIGVDTEMDSFYCYHEKVCLVQISDHQSDWLVDPLAVDIAPLGKIFANPEQIIVFHAGINDVPHLKAVHNFVFNNLFDTYAAANILDYTQLGLASLLELHFKVVLDKRYQRADWNIRPLPDEMAAYARYDTRFLLPLRELLLKELIERKRLKEAKQAFKSISQAEMHPHVFDPNNWCKIKGLRLVPPDNYGILKSLYIWRDKEAQRCNLPPFRILPDQVIVKIAINQPTDNEQLMECFSKPSYASRLAYHYPALLQTVQQGMACGRIELPATPSHSSFRLTPDQETALKQVRLWRNEFCQTHGILPEQIVSNRVLREIVLRAPKDTEQLSEMHIIPERKVAEFGPTIIEIISSLLPYAHK